MKEAAYYFGCVKVSGHYLWSASGSRLYEHDSDLNDYFPVQIRLLDGGFIPPSKFYHPQGKAFLSHVNGWTIIAFNDNSIDSRYGSNSTFILRGVMSFNEAIEKARADFPRVFARFTFEIVPANKEVAKAQQC